MAQPKVPASGKTSVYGGRRVRFGTLKSGADYHSTREDGRSQSTAWRGNREVQQNNDPGDRKERTTIKEGLVRNGKGMGMKSRYTVKKTQLGSTAKARAAGGSIKRSSVLGPKAKGRLTIKGV